MCILVLSIAYFSVLEMSVWIYECHNCFAMHPITHMNMKWNECKPLVVGLVSSKLSVVVGSGPGQVLDSFTHFFLLSSQLEVKNIEYIEKSMHLYSLLTGKHPMSGYTWYN